MLSYLVVPPLWITILALELLGVAIIYVSIRLNGVSDKFIFIVAFVAALLSSAQIVAKLKLAHGWILWKLILVAPVSLIALTYLFFVSLYIIFMFAGHTEH